MGRQRHHTTNDDMHVRGLGLGLALALGLALELGFNSNEPTYYKM